MANKILLSDPVFDKSSISYNVVERLLLKFINDQRDLVFVKLIFQLFLFVIPFTAYFYLADEIQWWVGLSYLAINAAFFAGRYILMLHCTSHRRLFRAKYNWMNNIVPWVLAPFFGETPETYFTHHIGMHHPENNLKDDLSSTMPYQRDSFKDFMRYFLKFFFLVIPDLRNYFIKKNRMKLMQRTLIGEISWYVLIFILAFVNFPATLVMFIIPLCLTRFMMMAGNWGQHAFIDPQDPGNCYRNSLTLINSHYNRTCFNDGYHIVHHLNPHMHYTDMPGELLTNKKTYAKEKAIIFEGMDFFMVWFLLMTKNYKVLARKFVKLDDTFSDNEQIIQFLKTRVARI